MILFALAAAETLTFQKTPIVTIGYIMQVILSLLIVLGLLWVSSKYLLPRLKFTPQGKNIEIIERVVLEPGLSAYIIKIKSGKKYVIAAGQKGIALLDRIEEGE